MKPDQNLDEFIRQAARQYNQPPETPREAIWQGIVAERQSQKVRRGNFGAARRWAWLGAAAAAALLVGIGIGRYSAPRPESRDPRAGGTSRSTSQEFAVTEPSPAYRLKMSSHLSRADVLLTQFSGMDSTLNMDHEFEAWAKSLLFDTRLLLESPATSNTEYWTLLEDLEFVLVQIVHASGTRLSEERRWIAEGLDRRGIMEKLRLLIPDVPGA